jgi:hypothetical protein
MRAPRGTPLALTEMQPEAPMHTFPSLLILTGILTTLAAQGERASWPVSQAPAELQPVISRVDLVIASMQDAVLREVNHELANRGAAGAVDFFHLDVTATIQRLARQEGIAAGRTSDRLRNPTNAPRPWAAPLVNAHAGESARNVEGFVVDLGDKVGVLRPIAERPICAGCHGPLLAPGVRTALLERYPADKGAGFADGEIRGWFWVEMPKPR